MMKQLLTILTSRNFEEIDYFEAVSPVIKLQLTGKSRLTYKFYFDTSPTHQ